MPNSAIDPLVLGQRIRHLRRNKGLTLEALSALVGRPAPFLSQLENGKREPRLSLVNALAEALGTSASDLLQAEAPSRRSQLEVRLERAQEEPLYRGLQLPYLKASAKLPDAALEHLMRLYTELASRSEVQAASPEGARQANAELRIEMRRRDNHFQDIEQLATSVLAKVGWDGPGAVPERTLLDIAAHFGFSIRRVRDLPSHTRSVTDLRNRVIFVPQRNAMATRNVRSVVLQTLGHFALDHSDPRNFAQHLRQRVEANYFAGAVLAPENAVVPFLRTAKARRDLSVEDLKEVFYISYEMAAHRFTNLATRHLSLAVHFLRADEEGIIGKAYENDSMPFPTDAGGAIEGQRACRWWGARSALRAEDKFDIHYQFTDTPDGAFWDATHVEADAEPYHSITVGVGERDARWFHGGDTNRRLRSSCPQGRCCREPSGELAARWNGMAWPSTSQHSHVLSTYIGGTFPGVDLTDVYEFLDEQERSGDAGTS